MEQSGFDNFGRIAQLADMFALISGKSFDESSDIILSTEYGREISSNNPAVMYEQATENLRAVAEELGQDNPQLKELFTAGTITEVYINGDFSKITTKRTEFHAVKGLEAKRRKILKQALARLLNHNEGDLFKDRCKISDIKRSLQQIACKKS